MAPEQARGSEEVDSRADVWSFCVVLYELVSGVVPFPGAGTPVFRALAEDPVPSLVSSHGIDPALWTILERGLTKNPDDRWPSIRWVGEALAEWLISRGVNEDVAGGSLAARWGARAEVVMHKQRASAPEEGSPSATPKPIEEPEVYNVDLVDLEPSLPPRTSESRHKRSSIVPRPSLSRSVGGSNGAAHPFGAGPR